MFPYVPCAILSTENKILSKKEGSLISLSYILVRGKQITDNKEMKTNSKNKNTAHRQRN